MFDAAGDLVLRVPEDIQGAVDGGDDARLVDGTVAITWQDASLAYVVELVEIEGGRRHVVPGPAYVDSHARGGDGMVLIGAPGSDTIRVVDGASGSILDRFDGQHWAVRDHRVLYRSSSLELVERDWRGHTERTLAAATAIQLDAMAGIVTPDHSVLALGDGAPSFDLADNVGIQLLDPITLATTSVEPAGASEIYTRRMQFSSNGDWLLYLAPNGSSIQLVGYERHTQERRTLTTGDAPVRQFVIP